MRPIKEASVLSLLGLAGCGAGWWFIQLFGMVPTCELLKYGGAVVGAFFLVMRRLNAAFDQGTSLAEFDATTRQQFHVALLEYRKRFRVRMIVGVGLGAFSATVGILVGKSSTVNETLGLVLVLAASATLTASATMVAVQLWVSSWPSEYLASIRCSARAQLNHRLALTKYSVTEEQAL